MATYCKRRKPGTCKRLTKYSRTNVDKMMSAKVCCQNCGRELGGNEKETKVDDLNSKNGSTNSTEKIKKNSVNLEKSNLYTPTMNSISGDMDDMTDAAYNAKLRKKTRKDIELEQHFIARCQMTKRLNFCRHQVVFKNLIPLDVDEAIEYMKKNPKLFPKTKDNSKPMWRW
ncbi:uncharacterized protein LOC119661951 [Teleopsis dalmanni]|uniref:uncharacterized protein LOC119661951 n=1 Tax=Teleopsis dalmanni TaxID=139649 RepID=UPI000D32B70E|nr:uncharacterized protein LOC119661951 [Teleopsis dalmanni]